MESFSPAKDADDWVLRKVSLLVAITSLYHFIAMALALVFA
ncbi:MAG TPA: hypothetical protein VKB08_15940 [Bradyrhizobium sp.]|nr:hypothetical protein [Bradyrhizobium sp.]